VGWPNSLGLACLVTAACVIRVESHPLRPVEYGHALDDMAEPSDSWTTLCGQASQAVAEACELFGPGTQQCLRARRIHQLKGCPTLHVGQSLAEQYRRELARLADSTGISEDGQDLLEAQTTTKVPSTKDDFFAGQGKSSASKQIIELGETKPGILVPGMVISMQGGKSGKYCIAHPITHCNLTQTKQDAVFHVIDGGDGYIGLKAHDDMCHDESFSTGKVKCHEGHIQDTEKFKPIDEGEGSVALQTKSGEYCSDQETSVHCHATYVTQAEKFAITCLAKCQGQQIATQQPTAIQVQAVVGNVAGINTCDLEKPYEDQNVSALVDFISSDPAQITNAEETTKDLPTSCLEAKVFCFHAQYGKVAQTSCCNTCAKVKHPERQLAGNPYHQNQTNISVPTTVDASNISITSSLFECLVDMIQKPANAQLLPDCQKSKVANGTSCGFTRPGHDCTKTTCTKGHWLPVLPPTCTAKGCALSDLRKDGNTTSLDAGCSANDDLVLSNHNKVPSGVNCSFTKIRFTCPRSGCFQGRWSKTHIDCIEDSVAATSSMNSALEDEVKTMMARDVTKEINSTDAIEAMARLTDVTNDINKYG